MTHDDNEKRSPPRADDPQPKSASPQGGYGKQPPDHQFKPGKSGNPKGRPKGAKNESTILRDILTRKIAYRSGGTVRKISVLEGIHLRIADNALKGDIKSAAFLFNRYGLLVSGEIQPQDLSDDDREVLEAFAQRIKSAE